MNTAPLKLENPYGKIVGTGTDVKVSAWLPKNEHDFVRAISLKKGTVQYTICLLWQKLVAACKENNINSAADEQQYIQFLTTARLVSTDNIVPIGHTSGNPTTGSNSKFEIHGGGKDSPGKLPRKSTKSPHSTPAFFNVRPRTKGMGNTP